METLLVCPPFRKIEKGNRVAGVKGKVFACERCGEFLKIQRITQWKKTKKSRSFGKESKTGSWYGGAAGQGSNPAALVVGGLELVAEHAEYAVTSGVLAGLQGVVHANAHVVVAKLKTDSALPGEVVHHLGLEF